MPESLLNRWIAVHVRPQSERMVSMLLRYKGYEDFVPQYQPSSPACEGRMGRERPVFPGYVFCRMTGEARGLIVTTPGVIRIVSAGNQPLPVDDSEIDSLRLAVSSGRSLEPWPHLERGDWVELTQGPLRGCRGYLKSWKNARKLLITVTLLQRAVAVELDREAVRPLTARGTYLLPGRALRAGVAEG
jgi:transcription antitermination factor NusG